MATILIADDRPADRQYLANLLGYFGHRLLEASDGSEALDLARAEHPDLLICDLIMPGMDGQELVAQLHADPALRTIPVILYSATYSLDQAQAVARSIGAFGVLPKPSEPEVVLHTVYPALGLPVPSVPGAVRPSTPAPAAMESLPREIADLESISHRLSALIRMGLELAAEPWPGRLLERLGHVARELVGAKYAAVGVLSEDGRTARVFLSGSARLPAGENGLTRPNGSDGAAVSESPHQESILGRLVEERQAIRLRDVSTKNLGLKVPLAPGRSQLDSLLAVPLVASGGLQGWVMVADKLGAGEFSGADAGIVSTLASHAALAYERLEERRRSEEELRKSKRMFETLFESTPDALVASDQQGYIVQVNAQAESLFGYARAELLGQPVEILVPERFQNVHAVERIHYQGKPRVRHMGSGLDLRGMRKDSSEFLADITLNPIDSRDGRLVLSAIRDVTARKEAEDRILNLNHELEARVAELQEANQSLEAFSYSVSHDLRAPLRSIDGFSRVLAEDYASHFDAEGQRVLAIIASSARKMGNLIEDLLSFSRISRGELHKSDLDMKALAESVVDELRASQNSRRVTVDLQAMPPARGDRALIRQVYANLVANAWKFTRQKPDAVIEIGAYRNGQRDVFFVRDNGAGFDMKYSQKLFGVFQRLHSDQEFEGTGIGLALVGRIIQRHGGKVWAEGKPGEGATFYFTL